MTTTGFAAPAGWYEDPSDDAQLRWWTGSEWTMYVHARHPVAADEPERQKRAPRPGVAGAAIILFSALALWAYAACAELFWLGLHGSRLVIVALASFPSAGALLYLMCRRLRPADRLTPSLLIAFATIGGFVALIVPSLSEPAWAEFTRTVLHQPLLAPFIAGPLEEACKLAVVAVLARWVAVRNARTGLFVGGAVGLGYAVFENIDYALSAAGRGLSLSPAGHLGIMVNEMVVRQVITPFLHPLLTAVCAAALFASVRGGKLRIGRLVVLAFVWSVVMHSLWDDLGSFFDTLGGGFVLLEFVVMPLVLIVINLVAWRAVARRANRSLDYAEVVSGALGE